ncbi:MAG: hypothetical protein HZA66_03415 [Rhodopseudomonas palustris]|uniref:Uncharacterized protein n=1 Tax=Rhodopseudomonas palustris TaxID=1076 RepID=A0A933W0M3_RHOPL|nr:hypothetical protein [Rhodopseudomonas palustris]
MNPLAPTVIVPYSGNSAFCEVALRAAAAAGFVTVDLNDLAEFSSNEWELFAGGYSHSSLNSVAFEMLCFKRYFRVKAFAERARIESFIMIDTDVMLFPAALSQAEALFERMKSDRCVALLSVVVRPKEFWHASPHCSFWTFAGLEQFVAYLLNLSSCPEAMSDLVASNRSLRNYTGFSDMVALGAWMNANSLVRSILDVPSAGLWDHNITMSAQNSRRYVSSFGSKVVLVLGDGRPLAFEWSGWRPKATTVNNLHLQGKAKLAMRLIDQKKTVAANLLLAVLGLAKWVRQLFRSAQRAAS